MPTPNSFPAWVSQPGQQDAFVLDQNGYNAAVKQGYVYPVAAAPTAAIDSTSKRIIASGSLVTPITVLSATIQLKQTKQNKEQDDGRD